MLKNIVEALIFASGKGISQKKIIDSLSLMYPKQDILNAIKAIQKEYSSSKGFIVVNFNDVLQFQSNPQYGEVLSEILQDTKEKELSKTIMQVLAIIAYKQPITKSEIFELRGADPDYVLTMLLKLDLIEVVGRKDTIGRPLLFGTTDEFLKRFKLTSLSDLPEYEQIMGRLKRDFDKLYEKTDALFLKRDLAKELTENDSSKSALKNKTDKNITEIPDFLSGEDIIEIK